MDRRSKIIVSVVGIFIVLLALVGITYAYFLTQVQGNTNDTSISITTANLRLVYRDGQNIEAENIQPGDTVYTKTFTVTNEGNASIDYEVYLENVINNFVHEEDLLMFVTCTSNISGNTCNGYGDGTLSDNTPTFGTSIYPLVNSKLITNSIEPATTDSEKEVHTYTLYLKFKDDGTDQSDDMGKTLQGKVQIYDPKDIVTLTGTVSGHESNYYIEMHSDVKTSQIKDNKYILTGVEAGTHTLYLKYKDNSNEEHTVFEKNIVISKGTTPNITVTNEGQANEQIDIVITDSSSKATINVSKDGNEFVYNLGVVSEPLSTPTLSLFGDTLTITSSDTNIEYYEVSVLGEVIGTVDYAGTNTTYDVTGKLKGESTGLSVIAKAEGSESSITVTDVVKAGRYIWIDEGRLYGNFDAEPDGEPNAYFLFIDNETCVDAYGGGYSCLEYEGSSVWDARYYHLDSLGEGTFNISAGFLIIEVDEYGNHNATGSVISNTVIYDLPFTISIDPNNLLLTFTSSNSNIEYYEVSINNSVIATVDYNGNQTLYGFSVDEQVTDVEIRIVAKYRDGKESTPVYKHIEKLATPTADNASYEAESYGAGNLFLYYDEDVDNYKIYLGDELYTTVAMSEVKGEMQPTIDISYTSKDIRNIPIYVVSSGLGYIDSDKYYVGDYITPDPKIRIEGTELIIDPGADDSGGYYSIYIYANNTVIHNQNESNASYDLSSLEPGTYEIYITVGALNYAGSGKSNVITYTVS